MGWAGWVGVGGAVRGGEEVFDASDKGGLPSRAARAGTSLGSHDRCTFKALFHVTVRISRSFLHPWLAGGAAAYPQLLVINHSMMSWLDGGLWRL